MTIEQAIYAELGDDATFTAAIGSLHWEAAGRAPKLPAVVVQQIADTNEKVFLGAYGGQATLQFDIYGKSQADTADVRPDLKAALRRIRGAVDDFTVTAVRISNEVSQGPQPETGVYRYTIDAIVDYTE